MQRLRDANRLVRVVLAWFGLFVAISVASPVFAGSAALDVICSAAGTVAVQHGSDGGNPQGPLAMKCPLCMPLHAAAPQPGIATAAVQPLNHGLRPIPAARVAALTSAPLPARGPPASLLA